MFLPITPLFLSLATFFCRSGILQDRTGFKVFVLHSIDWPTAAFCSMMSMLESHLTLLIPGMMHFLTRYVASILVCLKKPTLLQYVAHPTKNWLQDIWRSFQKFAFHYKA